MNFYRVLYSVSVRSTFDHGPTSHSTRVRIPIGLYAFIRTPLYARHRIVFSVSLEALPPNAKRETVAYARVRRRLDGLRTNNRIAYIRLYYIQLIYSVYKRAHGFRSIARTDEFHARFSRTHRGHNRLRNRTIDY